MIPSEWKTYEKVKAECIAEDIKYRMQEMIDGGDIPEEANIPDPSKVERWLSHHDLFWDIYWNAITETILEENGR